MLRKDGGTENIIQTANVHTDFDATAERTLAQNHHDKQKSRL